MTVLAEALTTPSAERRAPAPAGPSARPPARRMVTQHLGWGYNNYGGIGTGHTARVLRPTPVPLPSGTVDVQGGTDFSIALTSSGQVHAWGGNRWGQLGDGTTTTRLAPKRVKLRGNPHVVAVAVGEDHVVALTRGGRVYAWGRNDRGQVGTGELSDRCPTPVRLAVPGSGRVRRIAAGNASSFAVRSSGALYGWGHAVPLGSTAAPRKVGSTKGGVGVVHHPVRLSLPGGEEAVQVDAGRRHLVVLTRRGHLLTFGVDHVGRDLPKRVSTRSSWGRVTAVSAGDDHTLALTDRGRVLAWGSNREGQLGTGDLDARHEPVAVRLPSGVGEAAEVAAAGGSSFVRSRSKVLAFGHAGWGQHGVGDTKATTSVSTVALPSKGTLVALHAGRHHAFATVRTVRVVRR